MYARLLTAHIQPTKLEEFATAFTERILPAVTCERGFKSTYMMKDTTHNKIAVLVFWETESDAQTSGEIDLQHPPPEWNDYLISQPTTETLEVILRA